MVRSRGGFCNVRTFGMMVTMVDILSVFVRSDFCAIKAKWAMKKKGTWLFRVYKGLYNPVI